MASDELVPTVAGAILDSEEIDWASIESKADLTTRPLLDELKLVAAVVAFHRQLPDPDFEDRSRATDDRRDPIPEMWGHLRVLERIGRGAFGEVFRAWETGLDREVALKLLPADSGDGRATSIIDEGRLLARVRHPNVATIYGAERIGNQVGLWMELVDGRTLEQMLRTGNAFTPARTIRIGIELCRALSAVHQAGLLHRDVKAQNVMVAQDDRVVLMDFGTGCDPNDGSQPALAGTPLYLAPELLDGNGATVQADIYSAGVLLHYMLQLTLTPTERAVILKLDTTSAEAFRHYMFGRYHLEVREGNRMRQAEREFREALKLDPQYARAHAALALTLAHLAWLAGEKANEVMPQAKEAALKALAIDETVALAHTALAHVHEIFDYDPVRAQAEHLRAMQLDDQDLWVLRTYATFLMSRGETDEGLALNRRALDLDPTAPLSMRWQAMLLYVARRYDDCVTECRKALTLDPNDGGLVYNWLPRCLEAQGKKAEAVDAYEQARALRRSSETAEQLKAVYAAQGWEAYWRARLNVTPGPGQAAFAHLRLGNTDEVIALLQQLYDARAPWVVFTNQPEWDPVRSDPRFQALRRNAGLSDDLNPTLAAARRAANATYKK
jgi:Tfp pilus assembly protein PilF